MSSAGSGPPAEPGRPAERDRAVLWVVAAVALALRVALPYRRIFDDGFVNFQSTDAWYHVRLIESLVHNFPGRVTADPYALPGGQFVPIAPLFDFFVALVAWTLGLGSPSSRLVENVAAFAPPVMGAAVAVPIYAFTARMLDRRAGLLAAALVAVMPGPLFDRTLLGVMDHHALEALLASSTLVGFLVAADGPAGGHRRAAWAAAGLLLGLYLLTWASGAFLVFVLVVWGLAQATLDHFHGRPDPGLGRALAAPALVALVLVFAFQDPAMARYDLQLASLGALVGAGVVVEGLGRALAGRGAPRWSFAAAVVALVLAAGVLARIGAPVLVTGVLAELARLQGRPGW